MNVSQMKASKGRPEMHLVLEMFQMSLYNSIPPAMLHITKLSLTAGMEKGTLSNLHPPVFLPPTDDCQRIIHLSSA